MYVLTLDGDGYLYKGRKTPFSVDNKQVIKVRNQNSTTTSVPFEVRRSVQGPVVEQEGKLLAVRAAGFEVPPMVGFLEVWFAMGRARSLHEFEAAIERLQIPTFNVIYADKDGHIMLVLMVTCRFDRRATRLSGQRQFQAMPLRSFGNEFTRTVIFPRFWARRQVGFRTRIARPPAYMSFPPSSPDGALSTREASGLRMLTQMKKISLDTLAKDKYSTRSELAEQVLDNLIAAGKQYGLDLGRHAADVPQKWYRNVDAESRGAALFAQWEMDKRGDSIPYAQPFDWKQPLRTPHGLKAAAALDSAAEKLQSMAGRLDVPWGDLYRLRRGKVDLPGNGGGEGVLGTFRIIDYSQCNGWAGCSRMAVTASSPL